MMSILLRIMTGTVLACASLLVRAQVCDTEHMVQSKPDQQYNIDQTGEVTDTKTGLVWMRCAIGMSGNDCSQGKARDFTWKEALQFAEDFNQKEGFAGKHDWRVPTIKEAMTLMERQCNSPAMNIRVFPNAPSYIFWSVSPVASISDFSWVYASDYGYHSPMGRRIKGYLRLVRYQ